MFFLFLPLDFGERRPEQERFGGDRKPPDDFEQGRGRGPGRGPGPGPGPGRGHESRSHFGPGAPWNEIRDHGGRDSDQGRRPRKPWDDPHSLPNWHPHGPDDTGPSGSDLRPESDERRPEKNIRGPGEERPGEFRPGLGHEREFRPQDGPGRDSRPGLLGSPPRGHDSDARPGLLGPPPQPGSGILGMGPPGPSVQSGNPVLRGSLLGPPPGKDPKTGVQSGSQRQEQGPRRLSNDQEEGREPRSPHFNFPGNVHSQHPQDLSSRGFRQGPRIRGREPADHPFHEEWTEGHGHPFSPQLSSRTFIHGHTIGPSDPRDTRSMRKQNEPLGRGDPSDLGDSQRMDAAGDVQFRGGLVDPRDPCRTVPNKQHRCGPLDPRDRRPGPDQLDEPLLSGPDDSRVHGTGPSQGAFDIPGSARDYRGRDQFPGHGPSGEGSDARLGRGPRGPEHLNPEPLRNQGDGKPTIPSLMSINPIPFSTEEKTFTDRDAEEYRGRKRSADGEGFRDGERERGLPKIVREDDEWRHPPRSQMDGPPEEWRGHQENWQDDRFAEDHYEEGAWLEGEQFRRENFGGGGTQSKPRGGWRGREGRR